jgi:hypothetical protein
MVLRYGSQSYVTEAERKWILSKYERPGFRENSPGKLCIMAG